MAVDIAVGGFTLGGVALGFGGEWWIQRRRDHSREKTAMSAILLETNLLAAVLEGAVFDEDRRRDRLSHDMWARFGPETINYLPQELVKALYLLHVDSFDVVSRTYDLTVSGDMSEETAPILKASLLAWAYHAERVVQLIAEHRSKKSRWPWHKKLTVENDPFLSTWEGIEKYAREKVKEKGFDTNRTLRVDFKGNVDISDISDNQVGGTSGLEQEQTQ